MRQRPKKLDPLAFISPIKKLVSARIAMRYDSRMAIQATSDSEDAPQSPMTAAMPKPADPLRLFLDLKLGSQERRRALARVIRLCIQATDDEAKHGGNFTPADNLLANKKVD
jgi:hypothetical protein